MKRPGIGFVPIEDEAAEILSVERKKGHQIGQLASLAVTAGGEGGAS